MIFSSYLEGLAQYFYKTKENEIPLQIFEILVFSFSYWMIAFKELVKAEYFKLVF